VKGGVLNACFQHLSDPLFDPVNVGARDHRNYSAIFPGESYFRQDFDSNPKNSLPSGYVLGWGQPKGVKARGLPRRFPKRIIELLHRTELDRTKTERLAWRG